MRPVYQTITVAGATPPIPVDYMVKDFQVGLFVDFTKGPGAGTVTVQYSYDDPWANYATSYAVNATWINHPILNAVVANADGSILAPVRAVRANCTILGSGTIYFTLVQSSAT